MANIKIPLAVPNLGPEESSYIEGAIQEGWVTAGGSYLPVFQQKMAERLGISDCVACQSGTAAVHLALLECGVGRDDVVIVPTVAYIAAVNPVRYLEATPIFMDCEEGLGMDPEKLKRFCEEECFLEEERLIYSETHSPVKAVLVTHVFGNMAEMEGLMKVAEQFHLKVVEDATQALGTRYTQGKYAGKFAGTIGDFGAFSFNGNKIMTTGGGGLITAREPEHLKHMKYLAAVAKDDKIFYLHNEVGYNYRMTNIQAAIGLSQLEKLDGFLQKKEEIYQYYHSRFVGQERLKLFAFRQGTAPNYWYDGLLLDLESLGISIRDIVEEMEEAGIETRPIWGLLHEQKPYVTETAYEIENADDFAGMILTIPCSTNLTKQQLDETAEALIRILQKERN